MEYILDDFISSSILVPTFFWKISFLFSHFSQTLHLVSNVLSILLYLLVIFFFASFALLLQVLCHHIFFVVVLFCFYYLLPPTCLLPHPTSSSWLSCFQDASTFSTKQTPTSNDYQFQVTGMTSSWRTVSLTFACGGRKCHTSLQKSKRNMWRKKQRSLKPTSLVNVNQKKHIL